MAEFCKCMSPQCPKGARWQVGFRIWERGIANRTKQNGVEGLTCVCVCDEHAVRDPDEFWTAKGKERMEIAFLQCGKRMPDFSTAQIIHTDITDGGAVSAEEAAQLGGFTDETIQ